ncbi:hypothetical protein A8B79_11800 [Balneola sp. EhC07]|uniref:hypothetical protein n=1 Tax=Balneola sp. EhC07 TaxID=1849360 RepID=UPI0007F378BB|nr:hypothetical protein [Balneola sp. EhC07]OAN59654.1 hypothetical protein A8B79_11800 [Balneola sp. EhC07]
MSEESTISNVPKWFLGVAIAALIWNLLGVFAYLGQVYLMSNPEMLAELSVDEQNLYKNTPIWATIGFTLAVWGGALGSLLLILKKKAAKPVLVVSLAGIIVQMYHSFFISNNFEVYGPGAAVMPVMIIIFGIGLVWLSDKSVKEGWLH